MYVCMYVCMYVWLCWIFIAVCGLSLALASRGYSSLWCVGFSLWWLLLLQSMGSVCRGFSSCCTRASVVVVPRLSCSAHVGSSQTRGWPCVPCIGRQILNHWATRETLHKFYTLTSHLPLGFRFLMLQFASLFILCVQ